MNVVAGARRLAPAAGAVRGLLAVVALPAIYVGFAALYAFQAEREPSPWRLFDELYYSELARAFAGAGYTATAATFDFVYPLFVAPAWLLDDTGAAYSVTKAIGVVFMASTVFWAYYLARAVVGRELSLFVAFSSVAVPALSYSARIFQEVLAYPYATLWFGLAVRALAAPTRDRILLATGASLFAPFIRGEFVLLPFVLVASALVLRWTGSTLPRRRRLAEPAALVVACAVVAVAVSPLRTFLMPTAEDPMQALRYAAHALGAFAIGLGILPLIAAGDVVRDLRDARRDKARRALASLLVTSAVSFVAYAAVKQNYLRDGNTIQERVLIYLGPLAFAATAVVLERRRVGALAVALGAAAALLLVWWVPLPIPGDPVPDAPGLAIPRELLAAGTSTAVARVVLSAVAVGAAALLFAHRRARRAAGLAAAVMLAVPAWALAGEVLSARTSHAYALAFRALAEPPPNWVDRVTDGKRTAYLGQETVPPSWIFVLAFWNRSISDLWAIGGRTAPVITVAQPLSGNLPAAPGVRYVVAGRGIVLRGTVVARTPRFRLWRVERPLHLVSAIKGEYPDGWMGEYAAYSYFAGPRPQSVTTIISRKPGWCYARDVPGHGTLSVGKMGLRRGKLVITRETLYRTFLIRGCSFVPFYLPVPRPPFRIEISIKPTFVPNALYPAIQDYRSLGAQVTFSPVL